MKHVAAFALALVLVVPVLAQSNDPAFRRMVYNASLKLERLDAATESRLGVKPEPVCTATAFQKTEKGYLLVSAGHCVVNEGTDDVWGPYYMPLADGKLSLEYGNPGEKHVLIPVRIESVGNWHKGWDVSILSVETDLKLTIIPLGNDLVLAMGDPVVSVSSPLDGDIKFWFQGYVSAKESQFEPETVKHDAAWSHNVLLQLHGEGGSSGAAVVSPDQRAIVGIFVGIFRAPPPYNDIVATCMLPVSIIKTFMSDPTAHTGIVPIHAK